MSVEQARKQVQAIVGNAAKGVDIRAAPYGSTP